MHHTVELRRQEGNDTPSTVTTPNFVFTRDIVITISRTTEQNIHLPKH